MQSDAENNEDDVQSNASEEDNILNDSGASNASIVDDAEFSSAVQSAAIYGMEVVEHVGDDIVCHLTDDAPNMPSLQQMHQLIAQSPRAQAKFFLLMDDIADLYFMSMDFSFIGRHHVLQSFHHYYREDQLASTAIPSLGGHGVAELEPFESQERGFEHGHRKKYKIPKNKERERS